MSKYPRTHHLPYSLSVTKDDRISKDVSSLIGIDIVITEKLDGSNTAMVNTGVFGRSHAVFTKNEWDREVRQLHELKIKGQLEDNVYIFGENMEGIHSIEYKNLKSYFYIFGVRDNNIWIPWESVVEYSYLLDIPTVPVLFKGKVHSEKELKELVEKLVSESSELGGEREGIVIRNAGMFHNDDFKDNVLKWVRKDHVQTTTHWTRNWVKAKLK
jgi:hypothetical protein